MSGLEQTQAFQGELTKVVDRFRSEFELTVAQAVGVLEVVKLELWMEEYARINPTPSEGEEP